MSNMTRIVSQYSIGCDADFSLIFLPPWLVRDVVTHTGCLEPVLKYTTSCDRESGTPTEPEASPGGLVEVQ